MNVIQTDIPSGFALCYDQEHGESLPDVEIEQGRTIVFPAFVRHNAEKGGYDWIPVRIPYKGQKLDDYERLERQCYAELRKYFYGTPEQQLELQYKEKLTEHINAVRKAFPNPHRQERRTLFSRYEVLKAFKTLPELYARLVEAYTANVEVALFWNSVTGIDLENEDCRRICALLDIDDALISQLIAIIEGEA